MAENASLFMSYNELQNVIRWYTDKPSTQELSLPQLSIAAAGAGAVTSFFLYVRIIFSRSTLILISFTPSLHRLFRRTPIELVKCKMQVQMLMTPTGPLPGASTTAAFQKLPGPIAVLMGVIRTSGFRGLWLGQTGTLIRETGGGVAWFISKEAVARLLLARHPHAPRDDGKRRHLAPWESAVSGACAGVMYNFALFPADTVKSAVQTEAEMRPRAPGEPYPSFYSTFKAMYKAQGIRGLYAGCGITVARAVPSSALIFLIYDGLSRHFE